MSIIVSNMECGHCVSKIQKALLIAGIFASFDLANKRITFNSESDLERAKPIITDLGYEVANA